MLTREMWDLDVGGAQFGILKITNCDFKLFSTKRTVLGVHYARCISSSDDGHQMDGR